MESSRNMYKTLVSCKNSTFLISLVHTVVAVSAFFTLAVNTSSGQCCAQVTVTVNYLRDYRRLNNSFILDLTFIGRNT